MCERVLIPLYDDQRNILAAVRFIDNLNLRDVPSYLNESENQGIIRVSKGPYKGRLIFMRQNDFYPSCNCARFISEKEAWERCANRGKYNVIEKYDIHPQIDIIEGDE
jgi:hypothetical protein